jgi:hypothetical protein
LRYWPTGRCATMPVTDDRGAPAARSGYLAQFAAPTIRRLIHE